MPWLVLVLSPLHQEVGGSIPGQGTLLDCGFNPQLEHIWEATD